MCLDSNEHLAGEVTKQHGVGYIKCSVQCYTQGDYLHGNVEVYGMLTGGNSLDGKCGMDAE